jgi:hypothetical protein
MIDDYSDHAANERTIAVSVIMSSTIAMSGARRGAARLASVRAGGR